MPFVHARKPVVCGRWAEPRVADSSAVTQGMYVLPILVDPCLYLTGSADGPVAGDDDIDVARHALEQPQRGEVVLDWIRFVVEVEQRNQDVRKCVARQTRYRSARNSVLIVSVGVRQASGMVRADP